MSANTGQRKLHGAVMGATVADFAGWRLAITCRGCCFCRTLISSCGKCPVSAVLHFVSARGQARFQQGKAAARSQRPQWRHTGQTPRPSSG